MRFVTLSPVLVDAAFGAVGLAAEGSRPDFSGTWIGVGPQQEMREQSNVHLLDDRGHAFQRQ
jgi:hypothetical protein